MALSIYFSLKRMSRSKHSPPAPGFFSRHRAEILLCAALAAAVWAVFGQTTAFGLVNFDDYDYLGENPFVRQGLTAEGLRFAFTSPMTGNWHPLTWLSLMADVTLFGLDAGAAHRTAVVLHAAAAMVLFLLLRQFTGALWRSAAVAGLFAIHPLHVESVAWISERKDVLSALFWFVTIWLYGTWARGGRSRLWFGAAHVTAALAMMSKPSSVTLPFTLLLFDVWPLRRFSREALPGLIREKALLFVMIAALGFITFRTQSALGATRSLTGVTAAHKLANAAASYAIYLRQTIWPAGLAPLYPYPETIPVIPAAAGAAVLIGGTALALRHARRRPYLPAGWFWYVGTLVPMIGIVQVGIQAHADRYTYVPLIGIFWIVAWGLHDLAVSRVPAPWIRGAAAAVFLALAWTAWAQAACWRDDLALFGRALEVTKRNRMAHTVVGLAHLRERRLDQAETHLRTALELDPKFTPSYRNLAEALFAQGRAAEALPLIEKAIELTPESPLNHYTRGIVLRALERNGEAAADLSKAIQQGLVPDQEKRAQLELGLIRVKEEQHEAALRHFAAALSIDPDYYLARKNLAFTLLRLDRRGAARTEFLRLAQMNPADPDVRRTLAALPPR